MVEVSLAETQAVETAADAPGREGILDAAAQLFVAQGYAATSLRQIASLAGLKAASIYHHFESKHALFVAVLDKGIAVMVDAYVNTVESFALSATQTEVEAAERLERHVRAHLGALFEHGPYTAAHVTAFFTAPLSVRAAVVPTRDSYESLWNDLLGELLPARTSEQVRLHRLILFGAMNTTIEWFDPSGDTSLDELATAISTQFLVGAQP